MIHCVRRQRLALRNDATSQCCWSRHDFSEKAICPLPDTEETDGAYGETMGNIKRQLVG